MRKGNSIAEVVFFVILSIGGALIFLYAPKQSLKSTASIKNSKSEQVIDNSIDEKLLKKDQIELIELLRESSQRAEYKKAYEICKVLEQKEPDNKWTYEKINNAYKAFLWEGEPRKWAGILYNDISTLGDSSMEMTTKKLFAEFYISSGPPMKIITEMKSLLNENNYDATLALGIWSLKSGQTTKAMNYLEKATEIKLTRPEAYYFIYLLHKKDNPELAEIYLKKALSYTTESQKNKIENLKSLLN